MSTILHIFAGGSVEMRLPRQWRAMCAFGDGIIPPETERFGGVARLEDLGSETLGEMIAATESLSRQPLAANVAPEIEIFRACAEKALAAGLVLPERLEVSWRRGPSRTLGTLNSREWTLDLLAGHPDVRRTVYHELYHVHDQMVAPHLDYLARERGAEAFAHRMEMW